MFEVKPWDTETDLKELFGKICEVRERPASAAGFSVMFLDSSRVVHGVQNFIGRPSPKG